MFEDFHTFLGGEGEREETTTQILLLKNKTEKPTTKTTKTRTTTQLANLATKPQTNNLNYNKTVINLKVLI